jgi:hypothetical protein
MTPSLHAAAYAPQPERNLTTRAEPKHARDRATYAEPAASMAHLPPSSNRHLHAYSSFLSTSYTSQRLGEQASLVGFTNSRSPVLHAELPNSLGCVKKCRMAPGLFGSASLQVSRAHSADSTGHRTTSLHPPTGGCSSPTVSYWLLFPECDQETDASEFFNQ